MGAFKLVVPQWQMMCPVFCPNINKGYQDLKIVCVSLSAEYQKERISRPDQPLQALGNG